MSPYVPISASTLNLSQSLQVDTLFVSSKVCSNLIEEHSCLLNDDMLSCVLLLQVNSSHHRAIDKSPKQDRLEVGGHRFRRRIGVEGRGCERKKDPRNAYYACVPQSEGSRIRARTLPRASRINIIDTRCKRGCNSGSAWRFRFRSHPLPFSALSQCPVNRAVSF